MKADNLLMLAVGGALAWMAWMALKPESAPSPSSAASSPTLSVAVASGKPVLVDFYATWCGPCMAMKPVVHELDTELHDKLEVVEINVDQNHDLAQQYGVSSIPCFVLLKDGKEAARQVGSMPKASLRQFTGL